MWDREIFLWLNFDGGWLLDSLMLFASGKVSWAPLYILLICMVAKSLGWRKTLLFVATIAIAIALSDITSGIFKHTGPLKALLPQFPVRLRPMNIEELDGLVHFIHRGGLYGTVSAHAATTCSIAIISSRLISKRWITITLTLWVAVVCYSRIYLGYHFPQDILLGLIVGAISAAISLFLYKNISRNRFFNSAKEKNID